MSGDDRTLDAALAALAGTAATDPEDDARWAKRVASRITTAAPMSRRELDPFLAAPFPDGFQDEDFGHLAAEADDHADHAAVAADVGGSHGWEGSMSEDSRPPGGLEGLASLTRSGPASSSALDGHAKADDSGLIDLRALSEAPPPVEESAAAAGAVSVSDLSKTAPAAPSSLSASKVPVASTASANAPAPSSTAAAAMSAAAPAAAAPAEKKKKGGAGLWIGLGGLAAAAAIAVVAVPMMSKRDEAPAASKQAEPAAESKKADEKVAQADKAPAATAAPAASTPEPAASAAEPEATVAAAPKAMAGAGGPAPAGAAKKEAVPVEATKPGAKPTATAAPTTDPINKPSGGSLDDVLGIGKDQPTAKKSDPTEGLPDKPDSLDVRSAINAKVGAASGCVKGLDGPSSVSVSFGPAGGVSGVAVTSGPAKGTGAEACIKNAFSSAKVPASKKGATGNATLVP